MPRIVKAGGLVLTGTGIALLAFMVVLQDYALVPRNYMREGICGGTIQPCPKVCKSKPIKPNYLP